MHPHNIAYRMAAASERDWTDTMKSLLGIMLRSKCKCRKSVNELRKLLPTWLALMNSSRHLRQIPKCRTAFIWLRWLITLLNGFLFFLTPPSTSSTRCVQNPWCYLSETVFWIQVWELEGAWGAHLQSVQMYWSDKPRTEVKRGISTGTGNLM